MVERLLEVNNLKTAFMTEGGDLPASDGVSFHVDRGETVGIVGESGCGKSITALSILRLVPTPGKIVGGEVIFNGQDILKLPQNELRSIRGEKIGMIFQEPLSSLNPVQPIGRQIGEVLLVHRLAEKNDVKPRVIEMLCKVGFPSPEHNYNAYPHELSGGMRQRAMIAMALIAGPQLIIADEPTTALDVTIQAQILDLLQSLREDDGLSVMLITHNLGIVAEVAHRVVVMYAGKVVEVSPVLDLFEEPLHPYTRGLLASVPTIAASKTLYAIPGMVPNPLQFPTGCRFHPRCLRAMPRCSQQEPPTITRLDRTVACWLYEGEKTLG